MAGTNSFSQSQEIAYAKYLNGENVFITGPGGTGKSYFIKKVYENEKKEGRTIAVTAMTGCAALLLECNAKTIHSWGGIGLGTDPYDILIKKLLKYGKRQTWTKTQLLIIDEVSMLSCELFELLCKISQELRKNSKPFGNMQIIFSGDFHQLPPVSKGSKFCFESNKWDECFKKTNQIELKYNFRQKDDTTYMSILNQIREGTIDATSKKHLTDCLNKQGSVNISPTILYPTKRLAEEVNILENSLLPDEGKIYKITFINKNVNKSVLDAIEKEHKSLNLEDELCLKVGSQVMCIKNLDQSAGIVNGSQGKVIGFNDKSEPIVRFFYNDVVRTIQKYSWISDKHADNGLCQIPLILSWAITIHKAQGITLEYAMVNIGSNIFEYGQTYVALSRVKSLEGLYIKSINFEKIKANPVVIDYYTSLNKTVLNTITT